MHGGRGWRRDVEAVDGDGVEGVGGGDDGVDGDGGEGRGVGDGRDAADGEEAAAVGGGRGGTGEGEAEEGREGVGCEAGEGQRWKEVRCLREREREGGLTWRMGRWCSLGICSCWPVLRMRGP